MILLILNLPQVDKPKSANRTLHPVEASAREPGKRPFVNQFDAGTSIKIECVNVNVLDNVNIHCIFKWLQAA
jgi:hypothetical protein